MNNQYKYVDKNGKDPITIGIGIIIAIGIIGSPAGKKAAEGASEAIGMLVTGLVSGAKAIIDAIPKPWDDVVPHQPSPPTTKVPEPCLPGINNLPPDILTFISAMGLTLVVENIYRKIKVNKKYKFPREKHHMVPHGDKYEDDKYSLDKARASLLRAGLDPKNSRENIVRLHKGIHRTTTNPVYCGIIAREFDNLNKYQTLTKLNTLRIIFRAIDNNLFPFDKISPLDPYY